MLPIVERYEQSGLNRRDFCAAEGLNVHTFKYWRDKIRATIKQSAITTEVEQPFTQIHPPQSNSRLLPSDANIHISLAQNIQVELPIAYPTEQLAQLLQYLSKN